MTERQQPQGLTGTPGGGRRRPIMPTSYLAASLVVMLALHFIPPRIYLLPAPWNLIGLAPAFAGLYLNMNLAAVYRRIGTTIRPHESSSALVTHGPYRFTRNPMYLGMVLLVLGLAMMLGTLLPFLVVPIFVWALTTRFIHAEERHLEDQFGEEYQAYKSRVRRWI